MSQDTIKKEPKKDESKKEVAKGKYCLIVANYYLLIRRPNCRGVSETGY